MRSHQSDLFSRSTTGSALIIGEGSTLRLLEKRNFLDKRRNTLAQSLKNQHKESAVNFQNWYGNALIQSNRLAERKASDENIHTYYHAKAFVQHSPIKKNQSVRNLYKKCPTQILHTSPTQNLDKTTLTRNSSQPETKPETRNLSPRILISNQ